MAGEDISSNLAACEALTEQHEGVQLIICDPWLCTFALFPPAANRRSYDITGYSSKDAL